MALPMRARKLIGTFVLLAFIVFYAFATMMLGLWVLEDASGGMQAVSTLSQVACGPFPP